MKKDRSRIGRLGIRLDPDEKEAFDAAAKLSGLALSAWVRERLRHAARKDLEAANMRVAFLRPRLPE